MMEGEKETGREQRGMGWAQRMMAMAKEMHLPQGMAGEGSE